MKASIKKILQVILPQFLFNFFKKYYGKILSALKISRYTIQFTFKRRINTQNLTPINQPLILISQMQRSGGTLLSQLLDGVESIYAYPSELALTSPKWDWSREKNYICYKQFYIRNYAERKVYIKESVAKNDLSNKFFFDLIKQRQIFESLQKLSERDHFDAYFSSFFNSFLNFKNFGGKKKYISAFTPRIIMHDKSVQNFYDIYPDGAILSMIREPISWLASASLHSDEYKNLNNALGLWLHSAEKSLKNARSNSRTYLVIFEELLRDTRTVMTQICKKLEFDFHENLLIPTFNSEHILSDSSFKAESGIDLNALDRRNNVDLSTIDKKLLLDCQDTYNRALETFKDGLRLAPF